MENSFDMTYFQPMRITRALRLYTDVDLEPVEDSDNGWDLYHAKRHKLDYLKQNGSWQKTKKNIESVAYSTIEVRKAANGLHEITTSIRTAQKMSKDILGSSTVFLLRLLATYPLKSGMVKSLLFAEFGYNPPDYLIYQANKYVSNIIEHLPTEEIDELQGKDFGMKKKMFEANVKFVPSSPHIVDFESLAKLTKFY